MLTSASLAHAARIEAIPGKKYALNKELGPWMVMVASFQTTSEDGSVEEGKTPEQAADELVLELRQRGIPAYVHSINLTTAPVITQDSAGRAVRRKNLRQQRSIGVLAGNYKGIDDSTAQKTLKWLKAYNPKCLQDGVIFEKTEKRPTPLAGAFMTINPLIPPEEVAAYQSVDNFVLRLNHSERNSLLENKGKFTLVVATFAGKTGMETPLGSTFKGYQFTVDDDLDIAAQEARDLAATMRQVENVDAYVWHDRYQSVVTVGAFSSANDPTIKPLRARYGARQSVNALVTQFNNSVQVLAIDAQGRKIPFDSQLGDEGGLATGSTTLPAGFRIWAFDPNPQLMAVPRTR
ncbi:MAG: hypothetical protein U0992_02275 [Planctomycetaceae bacterium]